MTPPAHAPLAWTTRSGMIESVHYGSAIALGADGSVLGSWGEPDAVVYPRSAVKPLQLVAMLDAGLALPADLVALVSASHNGEASHVGAARRILDQYGLDESELRNTPDWPLHRRLRQRAEVAGEPERAIAQNCSGKHAGMLATCVVNDWPRDDYLDPGHPLQIAIRRTAAELAGPVERLGIDGCGAPAPAVALAGLARAFSTIATSASGAASVTASAIREHPYVVGGQGRYITGLLRAVPGLIAKEGAEAVLAGALPDGRAFALKISDGGERAMPVIAQRLLGILGETSPELDALAETEILGHGEPVGRVAAAF